MYVYMCVSQGPWSHHVPSPHASMEDIFRYLDRSYRVLEREKKQRQSGQDHNGVGKRLGCVCHMIGPRDGWDLTPVG